MINKKNPDNLDTKDFIIIREARTNNLKNISLGIPRNSLTVVTGLSGCGKSSLAFDTIYAEGRRMYMESLNSYARQFLGKIEKPLVKEIKGLAPAIAIGQKRSVNNSRSTVGTVTEVYDYLKLLYSRIGTIYSPVSGDKVIKNTVSSITENIYNLEQGTKVMVVFEISAFKKTKVDQILNVELTKGFTRILSGGEVYFIEELLNKKQTLPKGKPAYVIVDRFTIDTSDTGLRSTIADSVQIALSEGSGECFVYIDKNKVLSFSNRLKLDNITFEEPSVNFFGFNNPYGVCKKCEGSGIGQGIKEEKVIPNPDLSLAEGAVAPWQIESMRAWHTNFLTKAIKFGFPVYEQYKNLSGEQIKLLWQGNNKVNGIDAFFDHLEKSDNSFVAKFILAKYKDDITCPDCLGSRIRKDAQYVKIHSQSICDILLMNLYEVSNFFEQIQLSDYEHKIAKQLLIEIQSRVSYLIGVGLGYLTLNRQSPTLSGGEYQRVILANSLGSTLVGAIYVLDEPTIGLHPRDTGLMSKMLQTLKTRGNTVIVVEHEEEVMRIADEIVDIGPEAGSQGGELVFQGNWEELSHFNESHTARYLNGTDKIAIPKTRRPATKFIQLLNCCENNLKKIDVSFPLNTFTVVTGVSGSGKSTLVEKILLPALSKNIGLLSPTPPASVKVQGDLKGVDYVDFISQNSLTKSSRSTPISYIKAYDLVRDIFFKESLSLQREYLPSYFSYNMKGGRCEECQGEGVITIDMQFMADVNMVCEHCNGKKFKNDILEVTYKDKNIYEVLSLTVDDSIEFFKDHSNIIKTIKPLQDVGLGYVQLGQSTTTLSGGEAQRLKLAFYLSKNHNLKHVVFIFDEPSSNHAN